MNAEWGRVLENRSDGEVDVECSRANTEGGETEGGFLGKEF